jgi:hypothetical protein
MLRRVAYGVTPFITGIIVFTGFKCLQIDRMLSCKKYYGLFGSIENVEHLISKYKNTNKAFSPQANYTD